MSPRNYSFNQLHIIRRCCCNSFHAADIESFMADRIADGGMIKMANGSAFSLESVLLLLLFASVIIIALVLGIQPRAFVWTDMVIMMTYRMGWRLQMIAVEERHCSVEIPSLVLQCHHPIWSVEKNSCCRTNKSSGTTNDYVLFSLHSTTVHTQYVL